MPPRPDQVRVKGKDLDGNDVEVEADGLLARALCHEIDHLDGVLFFDRISEEAQRELDDKLNELETDFRSKQSAGSIPGDDELLARLEAWTKKYA